MYCIPGYKTRAGVKDIVALVIRASQELFKDYINESYIHTRTWTDGQISGVPLPCSLQLDDH